MSPSSLRLKIKGKTSLKKDFTPLTGDNIIGRKNKQTLDNI